MNKKILILSASPRKDGNSDVLCDEFIKGANESGNQTERIYFNDKKINYCTGCGVCFEKHTCPQKDDMPEVIEKMIATDVIVMASPVYFYCMDAQLKTLIDRTAPRYMEMKGKDFYFILTAADSTKDAMNGTLAGLRGFTACVPDAKEKGIVYGVGVWEKGDVQGKSSMKEAYEMGKSI